MDKADDRKDTTVTKAVITFKDIFEKPFTKIEGLCLKGRFLSNISIEGGGQNTDKNKKIREKAQTDALKQASEYVKGVENMIVGGLYPLLAQYESLFEEIKSHEANSSASIAESPPKK